MYALDGYYSLLNHGRGEGMVPTFELADGITESDVGKAVALDDTDGVVRIAEENDRIIGVLTSFQARTQEAGVANTGAVDMYGMFEFQVAASGGTEPARGDILIGGATAGVLIKDGTGTGPVTVGHGPVVLATRDDGSDKYVVAALGIA